MDQINLISQSSAIILVLIISGIFLLVGIFYSKKHQGINNYLVANRSVGTFSLTTSLVASALGAWILFGPASAATWGGIGAVIGYALGTAFPLFILIYLGKKIRTSYPKGKTIDVYYDPENPSDSVLNKGVFWPMYIVIIVMVNILIGSIWASFALTKYLKKRTAEAMSLFQEKTDEHEHPFSKYS